VVTTAPMWWHPALGGGILDSDGKFSQPNFDPEGFNKMVTKLTDVRGVLVHAWHKQL
jgi:hypothetical protein